ncbi:MAG: Flp family type IVb pilin [Bacteriovoracia bacterium]
MLKFVSKKIASFIRDEEGQSTLEYILILFAVVLIALRFKKEIAGRISKATTDLGGKIDEAMSE